MISYAKYKTKRSILESSTSFSILLDDSRTCSELPFGMKKKVPEYSGLFFKVLEPPHDKYSKICLKRPLKNRHNKGLMENGRVMKVKSIAECSPWSIAGAFCNTFDLH